MKYITVPPPIQFETLDGRPGTDENGQPLSMTFAEFVLSRIKDPAFGGDMAAVIAAVEIREALRRSGAVLCIDTAHWARLREATVNPRSPYAVSFSWKLLPFMRAIVEATDQVLE